MPARPPDFDAAYFRGTLGRFATGVTVVTACLPGGDPVGLTVSSFNSVSLDPPLVLWSLSRASTSLPVFENCERYVIHVLAAGQQELALRFARGSWPERFAGLNMARAPGGTPMLDAPVAAWFECHNRSRYPEGDHIILVGQVERCAHSDAPPLLYHAGGFDLTPWPPQAGS